MPIDEVYEIVKFLDDNDLLGLSQRAAFERAKELGTRWGRDKTFNAMRTWRTCDEVERDFRFAGIKTGS